MSAMLATPAYIIKTARKMEMARTKVKEEYHPEPIEEYNNKNFEDGPGLSTKNRMLMQ